MVPQKLQFFEFWRQKCNFQYNLKIFSAKNPNFQKFWRQKMENLKILGKKYVMRSKMAILPTVNRSVLVL